MSGAPPLTLLIKERVGQTVRLLVGTTWVTGEVVRVADDGQAVRLRHEGATLFVDILRVCALECAE